MSFRVRPANSADFQAIYEMAKLTGGGFTNLPADKGTLVAKLSRSEDAFSRVIGHQDGDLFVFVLEHVETGQIRGTCQVFSKVGMVEPFYSYRVSTLTQTSPELGKTFRAEMLTLCTDFEGCAEVGGLFLHPNERAGGLGVLLARSRYLFIKLHRKRFPDEVLAELRGVIDEAGGSPFWDAIAGRFFGMNFQEADAFNGAHGTRFIADLMPKTPIYTAMISENARAIMGVPHPSGRAAMRMLEQEGFTGGDYVDIFDGGPTMSAQIDQLRTVRECQEYELIAIEDVPEAKRMMLAAGERRAFACGYGHISVAGEGKATLDRGGRPAARHRPWRHVPRDRALTGAGRDQFRRHRRPEPQLCRASASATSPPPATKAMSPIRALPRCRASPRCGTIWGSAWRRAFSSRTRARIWTGWRSLARAPKRRATLLPAALSASAMWAANAATVSPAPDTEDGRCHLTVAQPAHHGASQP